MSIQVHVPLMKVGNQYVESGMADNGGVKVEKWRKVGNDGRSLYQSTKQTINIEFKDLTYSVSEGRQKGVYKLIYVTVCECVVSPCSAATG